MKFYYRVNVPTMLHIIQARIDSGKIAGRIKSNRVKFAVPSLYAIKESFPLIFSGRIIRHDEGCCIAGRFRLPYVPVILMAVVFSGIVYTAVTVEPGIPRVCAGVYVGYSGGHDYPRRHPQKEVYRFS